MGTQDTVMFGIARLCKSAPHKGECMYKAQFDIVVLWGRNAPHQHKGNNPVQLREC